MRELGDVEGEGELLMGADAAGVGSGSAWQLAEARQARAAAPASMRVRQRT